MNSSLHHLAIHAAYEHVQIDMHSGAFGDGVHPIYRYPDSGITINAVIEFGNVVDVTAVTDDGNLLQPLPPPDHTEAAPNSALRRAWSLPHHHQTLHAEWWLNHTGEGFVDLFIGVG